ncbi:hypothetical protein ASZ82_03552 [Vibrio cholerae]|uniref:ATP-binding cassette domain-containing protein n=1 Tax=Vibrio cholerae TaxID=666 RepID=UPI00090380DF|nr:ATP-binding cassette domain-containing protein [Vibrio cholerae]APF54907.1 hypothetical protein ASZ82_03552 [Vibrio cholerae]
MQTSIISAQSLSKLVSTNQEHLTILKQVNLSIQAGESVAIVGASGAGKSTLMTLLAGLDTPSEGEVYLLGKPLSQLMMKAAPHCAVNPLGLCSKVFCLFLACRRWKMSLCLVWLKGEAEDRERAQKLLKAVGLEHRMHHSPAQLSGGEQQRVAICSRIYDKPPSAFC